MIAVAVIGLIPRWFDSTRHALTASSNEEFADVSRWVQQNIVDPSNTRILVDDNLGSTWSRSGSSRRQV